MPDSTSPARSRIVVASDGDWVRAQVRNALAGRDVEIIEVTRGQDVRETVASQHPALVILDLQIGNMGGMAVCMALRHEESGGRLPHLPVLMLLDRHADLFLARRSHADGWLVKPLDSFRLRRAAEALLAGGEWFEGEAVEASMGVADAQEPG